MYLALTSASGAPGVSTTALGLALQRQQTTHTLLVEADPVGSSPTIAGFLRSEVVHDRSLKNLINAQRHGDLRPAFPTQALVLPDTQVSVLPGLIHAGQAAAMRSTWAPLGESLTRFSEQHGQTIVVDAGRMGHEDGPVELLRRADLIGVVVRPTLPKIAAVKSALVPLMRDLATHKARARIGLLVIGSGFEFGADTYTAGEIAKAVSDNLGTTIELIATLPDLPREARALSEGVPMSRWRPRRLLYQRALRRCWHDIEEFCDRHDPPWLDRTPQPRPAAAGVPR